MFGNRYFGARYFGDRYFGPGGDQPPVPGDVPHRHGGIAPRLARRLDQEREEFEQRRIDRQQQLEDIIALAFRRANGEIDDSLPAFTEPVLPPFVSSIPDALATQQALMDEEAVALLLLVA